MSALKPLLIGLGLLALSGCDQAEQAASNFAEKVEQAAVEQARESFGETLKEFDKQVDQLNDKVDQAQESTRQWLDQAQPKQPEQPEQLVPEAENTPQQPGAGTIET